MKVVIITDPLFLPGEEEVFRALLDAGVSRIHLRKPGCAVDEMEELVRKIPSSLRDRFSLHDHFPLSAQYGIGGLHLNGRNPVAPEHYSGILSRSCHSLQEVERYKQDCGYVFLSPIFDSISKQGYSAHFSAAELKAAAESGVLDRKVIALGGIVPEKAQYLKSLGFGGGALLGYVWEAYKHGGAQVGGLSVRLHELSVMAGI